MTLLVLGGTADGRRIASAAFSQNINVIYSVAGLVRIPDLACKVISGGFTQFGGLEAYIYQNNIQAIIDVTHPYAAQMSAKAATAAVKTTIPYWRYHRMPWVAENNQKWHEYQTEQQLVNEFTPYSSVLLSIGQLTPSLLSLLNDVSQDESFNQQQIVRTAAAAKFTLLSTMQWIKAIGPFTLEYELALLKQYNIDVIVTKNSGGEATRAKLKAAQILDIPVYIQARPELPIADELFTDHDTCLQFLKQKLVNSNESLIKAKVKY